MSTRLLASLLARTLLRLALLATALLVPGRLVAQDLLCDPGDLEVRRVQFSGNRSFRDAELADAIATTPSSWTRRVRLPLGTRRCLDSLEFQRDVYRLRFLYRQRGFYRAEVDTAVRVVDPGVIAVTFRIREGPPVIIDSLRVLGLDTLRDAERLLRPFRDMEGQRFDRQRLQAAIEQVLERLRNSGYARAEDPLRSYDVNEQENRAAVQLEFLPGRVSRIGDVRIHIEASEENGKVEIPEQDVRAILSFREGDVYRERDLLRSQRDLYQLETYRTVEIRLAPDSMQAADSLLTVLVRLGEANMHTVRLGVGWATLDCFRAQGRVIDRDFLGGARRMELNARLTKIGRGEPLDGADRLCMDYVRTDPFSEQLNYYGGVTFRQPTLFGSRNVPTLTLYGERRSEYRAYLRHVPYGAVASVTREQRPRLPITLSYSVEYGRTSAEDAVFCSIFNICNRDDIASLQQGNQLAVAGVLLARDRTNHVSDPTRGDVVRLEFRHASDLIGSDTAQQFNKWLASASWYHGLGKSATVAVRVQAGGVLALGGFRGADFVPTQERFYGGGPNSVRGFQQNQLGQLVYLFGREDVDTVTVDDTLRYRMIPGAEPNRASPTGGNALAVANFELRVRGPFLRDILQWAAFVDAGQVWNRSREAIDLRGFRVTPGVGLRLDSPVGPIRFDVGYNRYRGQAGAAFFEKPAETFEDPDVPDVPPELICVSGGPAASSTGTDCPRSYVPPVNDRFFRRLTLHFSIGQAF